MSDQPQEIRAPTKEFMESQWKESQEKQDPQDTIRNLRESLRRKRELIERLQALEATLQSNLGTERERATVFEKGFSAAQDVIIEQGKQLAVEREKREADKLRAEMLEAQRNDARKQLAAEERRANDSIEENVRLMNQLADDKAFYRKNYSDLYKELTDEREKFAHQESQRDLMSKMKIAQIEPLVKAILDLAGMTDDWPSQPPPPLAKQIANDALKELK